MNLSLSPEPSTAWHLSHMREHELVHRGQQAAVKSRAWEVLAIPSSCIKAAWAYPGHLTVTLTSANIGLPILPGCPLSPETWPFSADQRLRVPLHVPKSHSPADGGSEKERGNHIG